MIFVSIANAQWQKQTVETDAGFRGLSVVSENVIWASGTGGTVIRTTDGGKNWQVIKSSRCGEIGLPRHRSV